LKNQDLFKYVTHLKFSKDLENFHFFGDQVKLILDCFHKLTFLSFPIGSEFYSTSRNLSGSKTHLTLAPLQSLQNITVLTLDVNHIWSFVEAFELPPFLRKLTLNLFQQSFWADLWAHLFRQIKGDPIDDEAALRSSERYRALLDFFEKFKRLASLISLDLNVSLLTQASEAMKRFILPLIRAIPKLEHFECQLDQEPQEFDISIFLDGIASLGHLKSFKVFQSLPEPSSVIKPGDLVMSFDPLTSYHFPNLSSVHIGAWMPEDYFDFKKFLKMFSTELKEITLAKVYSSSIQSFIRLLRGFSNIGQIHSTKINISITLYLNSFGDLRLLRGSIFIPDKNVSITATFTSHVHNY